MSGSVGSVAVATANPNDLVGSGSTHARVLGGIVGGAAGVGTGLLVGNALAKSPLTPLRFVGAAAPLVGLVGGAFGGQMLLGKLTRGTQAEADRARQARLADLSIQARTLEAEARGDLTSDEKSEIGELRHTRIRLVESKPEANAIGKWVLPVGIGIAGAVLAGRTAYRLTPDDGKGINAMFNSMFAAGGGLVGGAWLGNVAGSIFLSSPHLAELPPDTVARIGEIDARISELVDPPA